MMATTTAPANYLECDGSAVSRTTYADLFAIIGTTWGEGDGSSTFNVPDLRGEFVRGWDNGKGTDSGRSFASSQADQNKQHNHSASATSSVNDPGHFHDIPFSNSDSGEQFIEESGVGQAGTDPTNSAFTGISVSTSVSIGNSGGNESRPRNIAMMYVIKT